MSYLFEKSPMNKGGPQFMFDGARLIDAMVLIMSGTINDSETIQVTYLNSDIQDKTNIERLKEELGTTYLEIKMHRELVRNNTAGDGVIKNRFQSELFEEFKRINTMLACFFLYFYNAFHWQKTAGTKDASEESSDAAKAALLNCGAAKTFYSNEKMTKPSGLSSARIIDQIKSVYPFMHNLYVGYLEEKYGANANIALMNIQDAKEQLQEGELLGQVAKIKPKKQAKLTLLKK